MKHQFYGKFILTGQILCVTGLHIGGSSTGIEIGGDDNPVIKDPVADQPYIPGSALKGKLRSLTEWSLGLISRHPKHNAYTAYACEDLKKPCPSESDSGYIRWQNALTVGRLFGAASDEAEVRLKTGPTRLTVRDAFLTEESSKLLEQTLGRGIFTEVKTENAIDRVTSEANPRPIERVPAGSVFDFCFIVDIYDKEDTKLFKELFSAMRLLESSSLGGSGSRGHGRIKFNKLNLVWRSLDHYRNGSAEVPVELPGENLEDFVKGFSEIAWPV